MPEPSAKPDRRQLGRAFIWEWGRRRSEEERGRGSWCRVTHTEGAFQRRDPTLKSFKCGGRSEARTEKARAKW